MLSSRTYPYLEHEGPIPFAHRGGAASGLENSLAAFQRAYDLGYRYVETDVHATADGVLLAFHDRTLDRVTDRRGAVASLSAIEVARARIGGLEPIPRLVDLLGSFADLRVNIDVKDAWAIPSLIDVVRRTGAVDRICVASFSRRRVSAVRAALGPRLATSYAPRDVAALRLTQALPSLRRLLPRDVPCVQVPPSVGGVRLVTDRFLAAAHGVALRVHVWTVNDPGIAGCLLDTGVDGVMTDDLEMLRDAFQARGLRLG